MDIWLYMILVTAFLGFFGLIESFFMIWNSLERSKRKTLDSRLQSIAGDVPERLVTRLKRGAYSANETVDKFLKKVASLEALEKLLRQAGTEYSVMQAIVVMAGSGLIVLLLTLVLGAGSISILLGLTAAALPLGWLIYLKRARSVKIESQLPDILDLLARAMRAGHSFSIALKIAGSEGPEPIASEFRVASEEINFGSSVREGIMKLAERVDSMDMRYFALAVMIQAETGGNLSGLLSELSKLIRERLKLRGQIRVLAAEGRLSAIILGSLPVVFGLVMAVFKLDYIAFFWRDPGGLYLIKVMLVLLAIGVIWINKMTNIRV